MYLWLVDTLALKRGTWTIESDTKLGFHLWDGLDIEYAGLCHFNCFRWTNAISEKQSFS